jgi:hypothetical protein
VADGPRWDTSAAETSACDIASASASAGEVVLSFGAVARGQPGATARLATRIRLNPAAARHFQELLATLVRQHDARRGPPE